MAGRVRIGSAPINWGVGPLDPANPNDERVLDEIAAAGYEGCELGTFGYFGVDAATIHAKFRARELKLVTTWHEVDLARPLTGEAADQIRLLCGILAEGDASVLLVSDAITPERMAVVARVDQHPETWWTEEEWRQVPLTLRAVAEVAAECGVAIALHPHVGGHVETGAEIRRALDLTAGAPIGLCVDTGHICLGGSDPIALLNEESARLLHVHAKDVDGPSLARLRRGEIDYVPATGEGLYSELGRGIVDWQGLKDGLTACGYAGWVVAEQDCLMVPGDERPWGRNARNFAFLRGLL